MYRIRARSFSVDQGSDGRVAAQLVQAAAPGGPDAPDWHVQPGADLAYGTGGSAMSRASSRW